MKKRLLAAFVSFLFVPIVFGRTLPEIRSKAESGDVRAMVTLGELHAGLDRSISADYRPEEAFQWFKKAAEQGDVAAQYNLAWAYYEGRGVPEDFKAAFNWYKKAAEQGDADAQNMLGRMYTDGKGVAQNSKMAVTWYRKAAEQGDAAAQYNLAWAYYEGRGVPEDFKAAFNWYKKAAEQGNAGAQNMLGRMYADGEGVAQNSKMAVTWYRKAAEQGHAAAQYNLARMYYVGKGVPEDFKAAFNWYKKAAEQDDADAQNMLGAMRAKGEGCEQNDREAVIWYWKAAEQGNVDAQRSLAMTYYVGRGIARDFKEAFNWYKKAAEQGDAEAQNSLGGMYENGEGVAQNSKVAVTWYRKAAEQEHAAAQRRLAEMYYVGQGVPRDFKAALNWSRKAAEQGDAEAQYMLGLMYAEGKGVIKDEMESLAWQYLAKANGAENGKIISSLEVNLGRQNALLAQQRAKELAAEIEAGKTKVDAPPAPDAGDRPRASGTGAFVSEDGLILTAAHVVEDAKTVKVLTNDGRMRAAEVLRVDAANDIAVLRCKGRFTPLPLAGSGTVRLGQGVFTIGFPLPNLQGFSPKFTKGEISSRLGMGDDPRFWQVSVPLQPGNSGGPLMDEAGNVVGVVVAVLGLKAVAKTGHLPQNVNYAVKSSYVFPLLEEFGATLRAPNKPGARLDDAIEQARKSVVLVLVY